jgi:hypothetical protein
MTPPKQRPLKIYRISLARNSLGPSEPAKRKIRQPTAKRPALIILEKERSPTKLPTVGGALGTTTLILGAGEGRYFSTVCIGRGVKRPQPIRKTRSTRRKGKYFT